MRKLLLLVALAGLALVLVPSLLYFGGAIEHGTVTTLMTWGTALWFIGAIPARVR